MLPELAQIFRRAKLFSRVQVILKANVLGATGSHFSYQIARANGPRLDNSSVDST